jgi:hypothetical protein
MRCAISAEDIVRAANGAVDNYHIDKRLQLQRSQLSVVPHVGDYGALRLWQARRA